MILSKIKDLILGRKKLYVTKRTSTSNEENQIVIVSPEIDYIENFMLSLTEEEKQNGFEKLNNNKKYECINAYYLFLKEAVPLSEDRVTKVTSLLTHYFYDTKTEGLKFSFSFKGTNENVEKEYFQISLTNYIDGNKSVCKEKEATFVRGEKKSILSEDKSSVLSLYNELNENINAEEKQDSDDKKMYLAYMTACFLHVLESVSNKNTYEYKISANSLVRNDVEINVDYELIIKRDNISFPKPQSLTM